MSSSATWSYIHTVVQPWSISRLFHHRKLVMWILSVCMLSAILTSFTRPERMAGKAPFGGGWCWGENWWVPSRKMHLLLYFWLHWVFAAAHGLSLWGAEATVWLWCVVFSLRLPLLLQSMGSRCADSVAAAHGLGCPEACGILAPGPGIQLMSLTLAGRF